VDLCNAAASRLEHPGLEFQCGDVRSVVPEAIEVMIALHACDIATDYAIHTGIRCNAAIIMCSPCCHKQIRPQLHSPGLLQPMLQYGLHLGQQAEMLTDSLRALYLEAC
ncbi:methyltransferase, partial [Pantoea sp. SIMBA_072]